MKMNKLFSILLLALFCSCENEQKTTIGGGGAPDTLIQEVKKSKVDYNEMLRNAKYQHNIPKWLCGECVESSSIELPRDIRTKLASFLHKELDLVKQRLPNGKDIKVSVDSVNLTTLKNGWVFVQIKLLDSNGYSEEVVASYKNARLYFVKNPYEDLCARITSQPLTTIQSIDSHMVMCIKNLKKAL